MVYGRTTITVLGVLSLLVLFIQGCSSMKSFTHGSDEQSRHGNLQQGGGRGLDSYAGAPSDAGADDGRAEDRGDQGSYPSLGLRASPESGSFDPEGGSLRGFSPVEGDQIAGEERLSRSKMGTMLRPVDRNERLHAELRREEAAAIAAGLQDVFYAYNRWMVQDDGMQALSSNAGWLKDHPRALLRISGHCDERGSHDYNLVLGEKRAHAAKNVLVELGVNPRQLSIVSYGKDRPFCRENDETCHQQNRRGHMLLKME